LLLITKFELKAKEGTVNAGVEINAVRHNTAGQGKAKIRNEASPGELCLAQVMLA
jgi:hypothetical protein